MKIDNLYSEINEKLENLTENENTIKCLEILNLYMEGTF